MKINIKIEDFDKAGVYKILNKKTGKFYIGSASIKFKKRLMEHLNTLKSNCHKNQHLQRAWNKYGEDVFEFSILEVCDKSICLEREQYYMDSMEATMKGYNINPLASGTPNLSKETIEKRRQTMLRRYANGELDHIKEMVKANNAKRRGIKIENTDHLKVPKTISDEVLTSRISRTEKLRELAPEVYVYSKDMRFLGVWRSVPDLSEWSLTEENELPMTSRFSGKERVIKGKSTSSKFLKPSCIQTAVKNNSTYKNLFFSYKPLRQVIDVEKQGELLGNPHVEDNQQPSLSSNTLEGSTTNTRLLPGNAEESNSDKSALSLGN